MSSTNPFVFMAGDVVFSPHRRLAAWELPQSRLVVCFLWGTEDVSLKKTPVLSVVLKAFFCCSARGYLN
jgi:hypothetical protein